MPKRARPEAADQLPRQWALLRLLGSGAGGSGLTVRELSEQLQTSKSNVERDLAALQAAGFPLASATDPEHRQRLRWKLSQPMAATGMVFGAAELLAMYAASCMLEFLGNTPIHMDLQSALAKVRASLAENTNKAVPRMATVFTPHLRDYVSYEGEDRRAILDDLMDATARQRRCRVTYTAADAARPKTYVIRPLRIFGHHNALYLFVQIEPRDDVRTLSVHRVQEVEVLDETFEIPHIDLDAFSRQAFGIYIEEPQDVEILFNKDAARYVRERVFHPAEQKEATPDGGVRYRVKAGGRNEIVAWVISFGGSAVIVQPEAWREDVRTRAERLLGTHAVAPAAPEKRRPPRA